MPAGGHAVGPRSNRRIRHVDVLVWSVLDGAFNSPPSPPSQPHRRDRDGAARFIGPCQQYVESVERNRAMPRIAPGSVPGVIRPRGQQSHHFVPHHGGQFSFGPGTAGLPARRRCSIRGFHSGCSSGPSAGGINGAAVGAPHCERVAAAGFRRRTGGGFSQARRRWDRRSTSPGYSMTACETALSKSYCSDLPGVCTNMTTTICSLRFTHQ